MSNQFKASGIVLSVRPVGENDKRLTILTREQGRIQAFASGGRKVTGRLHAVSQPLIWGDFVITQTRNYMRITSGECRDFFGYIKDSYDHILYSTYFAEVTEYFTVEGQDQRDILNLLYVTFTAMKRDRISPGLIRRIFEYRLLVLCGMRLQTESCVRCGVRDPLAGISLEEGGAVCVDCAREVPAAALSEETLYSLTYVADIPLSRLYSFTLSEEIFREFSWIVGRFFDHVADHRFNTAQMLADPEEDFSEKKS